MRHRIVLCGFSEFECRAMKFSFQHSEIQPTGFDLVYMLADADFAVVDADSSPAVDTVVTAGRAGKAVFVGAAAPPGAAIHLHRPIAPARILKALRELQLQAALPVLGRDDEITSPTVRAALEIPQGRTAPTPVEIVAAHESPLADDLHRPPPGWDEESGDATFPQETAPGMMVSEMTRPPITVPVLEEVVESISEPAALHGDPARANAKVAKRGAVRRAWLARAKRKSLASTGPAGRNVLVLDAEAMGSESLCGLLKLFGFEVTAVRSVAEARQAMQANFFAAYFLDITLDVGDGVGLLQSIHDQAQPDGLPTPEVLMVVSQLQPADRVRAALAGIGTPLVKPVTRGELARALESRGVALPADARRG